ncbi:NAD(P)-binding domain-containing protein [Brevibacillus choshinensis]|uniref:NAD(P)-binding domain-containing protein n=2 Tax=Brevibacillus choshinensis TaxID=54911 RepID=A0ABX7FKR9_BRECH|nr:NAD(P)-binding domain-containing protein [Brevibacillus choshinensis]QRG66671.1 NAD(P)-binding domain-containing protein [Brevibacillus choshinensis]
MNIAIIGSGHIGGTLGKAWAAKGHPVTFGSRDPQSERMRELLESIGPNAATASVKEAVAISEVVVLAVPGTEIERVLEEAGDLRRKIVVNATILFDGRSADEEVRRLANGARVVRAFHTSTWEALANPRFGVANATLFMSSDNEEAKQTVLLLGAEAGFDMVDTGGAEAMAEIEKALFSFWTVLSPRFGRDYAIRVLRREEAQPS